MNYELTNREINSLNYSITRIFYENQQEMTSKDCDDELRNDLITMNQQLNSVHKKFNNDTDI